jgi:hypothetical protein
LAFYVLIDDEQAGPFEAAILAEMAKRGEVTGDMLVWAAGMDDWAPARDVRDLAEMFPEEERETRRSTAPKRIAGGEEQPLDMGRAINAAIEGLKRQPGPALFIALIYCVTSIAVIAVTFGPEYAFDTLEGRETADTANGQLGLGLFLLFGVMPVLYGGLASAMIDLVRGERLRVGRVLHGLSRVWPLVLFFFLYMACLGVGLFVFVVPGIFAAVVFCLAPFIVMDSRLGAIEAMKESYKAIMALGWWRSFGLLVAIMLAMMIAITLISGVLTGVLGATSGIGLIVANLATLAVNAVFTVILHGSVAGMYEQALENHARDDD